MHNPGAQNERRVATRRYAPKTKSGCITCKIRRVKCDETKPSCNRCTSTKRKCDGYLSQNGMELIAKSQSESLRPSLVLDVSSDALEKRTFDFFRCRTVPCVAGYFQDHLWDRTVLQISHSEPAVRHAINALGAQHEENFLRRKARMSGLCTAADFRTSFPAMQYSKALTGLHKLLSEDRISMNVVLICSLAFIHFEAFRDSFVPALVHTENAIRLLQASSTFNADKIDPSLIRALIRLDVQGAMYLGMRVPGLPFYTSATDSTLHDCFQDLTHARDCIDTWSCRMYHFMRTEADDYKFRAPGAAPLEVLAKAHELENIFLRLESLLIEYLNRPSVRLTAREQHGLNMLRCRIKIDRIQSACCLYTEATIYDAFLDQFEEILAICVYTIQSDDADQRLFTVSLDEGLVFPLWYVSVQCRDSHIRRSALRILQKLPTGKNVWHVEALTGSAERCIEFEETDCGKESPKCEDIPEWRRVHSTGLDGLEVSSAKKRVRVYLRTRPNGMDGEWAVYQVTVETKGSTNDSSIDQVYDISGVSVDQVYGVTESQLSLLGQRTDSAPDFGMATGKARHWRPHEPLRLWLQCTEPQILELMEKSRDEIPRTLDHSIGTSYL